MIHGVTGGSWELLGSLSELYGELEAFQRVSEELKAVSRYFHVKPFQLVSGGSMRL